MVPHVRLLFALGLVAWLCHLPLAFQPALQAQDRTSEAIDAGIDWLLPQTESRLKELQTKFKSDRSPEPNQDNGIGALALQVYALVVAGVSVENPIIKDSFDFLSKMALLKQPAQEADQRDKSLTHTYSVACYIFALDAAISQMEDDLQLIQQREGQRRLRDDPAIGKEYRPRLEAAVEAILRGQNKIGAWRYVGGAQDFDNSNVQFAVLALGVGAKRHVKIDTDVWTKVVKHFLKCQQPKGAETKTRLVLRPRAERGNKRDEVKLVSKDKKEAANATGEDEKEVQGSDGKEGATFVVTREDPEVGTESIPVFQRGWDYEGKGGGVWNMTCAGLSSLLLARDNLRGKCSEEMKKAMDRAIRDGYGWLMGNWSPASGNYYGLYSIEKVGDIGEVEKFGPHDWYKEVSEHLLSRQREDGSWPKGADYEPPPISTAFALLVLNRATTLLTMNQSTRMMVSGKQSVLTQADDRTWVYLKDLNTSIHYPSLLRAIRMNRTGSAKLLRLFQDVIENYRDEWKGELVPEMASAREAASSKAAQKMLDDYLVKITGFKYSDPEDYLKWHRRWQRVVKMGESKKPEYKDALIKYYQATTKSVPLKKTIMWAMNQCKVREALPLLLDDLNNPKVILRLAAYDYFKSFFVDFPPPFDPNASQDVRDKQVAAIKEWYAREVKSK